MLQGRVDAISMTAFWPPLTGTANWPDSTLPFEIDCTLLLRQSVRSSTIPELKAAKSLFTPRLYVIPPSSLTEGESSSNERIVPERYVIEPESPQAPTAVSAAGGLNAGK